MSDYLAYKDGGRLAVRKAFFDGSHDCSGYNLALKGDFRKIETEAKFVLEFLLTLVALVLLLPLFLFVAIGIKIDSRGPVFYSQLRYGKDCKPIRVLKFRTMRTDQCDASGAKQCVENDPRVTSFGRFLRRSNIDELPQLLSVLRGDMALIGPRCHPIGMLAAGVLYEELVPHYHERHAVRPGITGLAQARGLRGPTIKASKAKARIAADLFYIRNYSLLLDFKIIVLTFRREFLNGSGF